MESLLCPTELRNALAKALFEAPFLSAGSVAFVPSHLMCTLPFNTRTALVVDVGVQETVLFPVSMQMPAESCTHESRAPNFKVTEGVVMLNQWESTPVSTLAVEESIKSLMLRKGQVRTSDNTLRSFSDADVPLFDKLRMAEDICSRFCFATTRTRGLLLQANMLDDSQPIETPPPDFELAFGTEMLIVPGYVRYNARIRSSTFQMCFREAAAECLFQRDSDSPSVPEAISKCILKVTTYLHEL